MRAAAFIGIGLQEDHIGERPALPLEGAGKVRDAARRLVSHARGKGLPLLVTADTHADDDVIFESFPHHCVPGTSGHALWSELELGEPTRVRSEDPAPSLDGATAVVIESSDHRRGLFQNLHADTVVAQLDAELYVVFGGPVEADLRGAVMGLLARGKKVAVVSDALAFLDGERASSHLAAMSASGAGFLTTDGALKL
ncbi:MAG: isochorismatase family protein [Deltaproteobacteria bacterium]|nr:isochorismatase family protein [Deltaproteobacteria bacterium]